MVTGTTLDINLMLEPDALATAISERYQAWKQGRNQKEAQWLELRKYLFATDTSTTTNSILPWKNSTTRPKLTQIRDNLQANYMAALFPTERWFRWEAGSLEGTAKEKAAAVEAYMAHKFRESRFEETVARCINDYIDYGNAVGDVEFSNDITTLPNGKQVSAYTGPRLVRISPLDCVFDISGPSFEQVPKITRTLLSFGQIEKLRRSNPDWREVADEAMVAARKRRYDMSINAKSFSAEDINKHAGLIADGFNSLVDYYNSGLVEFLEFEGDLYDIETQTFYENHVITIMDRVTVIQKRPISNWFGKSYKQHAGWRLRPDNLMAMGPLDNLVGLQYRLDHLENLKADVFDLIAFPVFKVKGYVEDFKYGPNERIYMEQDSDVEFMHPDTTALQADMEIARIEQTMEEMAGAPKQAMGIRTPGEKTAFEVQELATAAGRIFQSKVSYFERNFLEPLMNSMLEVARRNLNDAEMIKVIDNETGIAEFLSITPDTLKSKGALVPVGARHFAAQQQLVQNLAQLSSTGLYQDPSVQMHLSSKKIAKLMEENLNLEKYELYRPFVRIEEQMEGQSLMQQASEELDAEATVPTTSMEDFAPTQPQEGGPADAQ
jgi:hypothetical protein